MPRSTCHPYSRRTTGLGLAVPLALGAALIVSTPAQAQSRPPLNEPIALEGTMKQFYRAANVVVVTTMDGIEHVYHFTKDLIVHGGKKPGVDALEGLQPGTMVVIHQTMTGSQASAEEIDILGEEGLKITEGRVTKIDRRNREITIRYGNGTSETLRMTSRAAAATDADIDQSADQIIVVYYSDEAGHKIAHYFKKAS